METQSLILPSYAKINWFLRVGGKRPDGYHEICTAFQTISLKDELKFELADEISVESNDGNLPSGMTNIAVRAAHLLREKADILAGARITIDKQIPFPGGLGGGSSNAAVTLLGLSRLWKFNLQKEDLMHIAAELGSDVPFFLCGGTAIGLGRGTEIEPIADVSAKHLLVCTPNADVPTAEAFDLLGRERLTKGDSKIILNVCRDLAERLISGRLDHFNDFENAVFEKVPEIATVRDAIALYGPKQVLLSGSGASLFAVFEDAELLNKAAEAVNALNVRVFAGETVSRGRYIRELGIPMGWYPDQNR